MPTPLRWKNRVADTTASTPAPVVQGSTVFSLAGALPAGYPSYQLPATAAFPTGKPSKWLVESEDGSVWQLFRGTWTDASPDTLSVDKIMDGSSGPGVAVSFSSGTKRVFQVVGATAVEKALLEVTMVATAPNTTNAGDQVVPFNSVTNDSHGWWDTGAKKFTPQVPGWYRVNARVALTSSGFGFIFAMKNGSNNKQIGVNTGANVIAMGGSTLVYCNGSTDYIQLGLYATSVLAYATGDLSWMFIDGPVVPGD